MKKRVFVAINLPKEIKEELFKTSQKWSELPVRWTKKESLHITLCFAGSVEEEKVFQMKECLETVAPNHPKLPIYINGITLGPSEFKPRMIWANGEVTEEFHKLVRDLHDHSPGCECMGEKVSNFKLHITLARVRQDRFGRLNKIPPIREELDLRFDAESVELMESLLLKDGAEYAVLHSVGLKK
jgi:2'-5' RNA ligase